LEDTYVTIYNSDGEKWMNTLRDRLTAEGKMNGGVPTETSALLV
jgi:hypothetical protein